MPQPKSPPLLGWYLGNNMYLEIYTYYSSSNRLKLSSIWIRHIITPNDMYVIFFFFFLMKDMYVILIQMTYSGDIKLEERLTQNDIKLFQMWPKKTSMLKLGLIKFSFIDFPPIFYIIHFSSHPKTIFHIQLKFYFTIIYIIIFNNSN